MSCQWCDLWDMCGDYETLYPKYIVVISENNCSNLSRFIFQTNINIQNGNYKHGHTHTQTQKVCKTYTRTYTRTYTKNAHIWDMLLCLKDRFYHFCHNRVRCHESIISSIVQQQVNNNLTKYFSGHSLKYMCIMVLGKLESTSINV